MKLIALDVGSKRIGVAKADSKVRIAVPYGTIEADGSELAQIASFARVYGTNLFVIGLPRNNKGAETAQSLYVRNFAKALKEYLPDAKIRFQDESLTSVEAEERLKSRKKRYAKGEIDAEAAAIILQDFLESFSEKSAEESASADSDTGSRHGYSVPAKPHKSTSKSPHKEPKSHLARNLLISVVALIILLGVGGFVFYRANLAAVAPNVACPASHAEESASANSENSTSSTSESSASTATANSASDTSSISSSSNTSDESHAPEACKNITFTVNEGDSVQLIADNLASAGLVRNSLVFQLHYYFNYRDQAIKAGEYDFNQTIDVDGFIHQLIEGGSDSNIFSFTILPGDTLADIKKKLVKQGYTGEAVDQAFAADYSSPIFLDKPSDSSLEGYVFGETYEFYNDESIENILVTTFDQMNQIIEKNNLKDAFAAQGLNLHQGITLASVIQKEAGSTTDMKNVASVFYNRLRVGMNLGSDVTAKYAADLVDPDRTTYTNNSAVLNIDSPYNTRKHPGLPAGPICNPGEDALLAAAHPADTSYLYFLTGDDGVMYYSTTGEGHNQNIADHCQELCNVQL